MRKPCSIEAFIVGCSLSVFPMFIEAAPLMPPADAVPISGVTYICDEQELVVARDGRPFVAYFGVPISVWQALSESTDWNHYVATHIVGKYPTR